jgi:rubrerythrin
VEGRTLLIVEAKDSDLGSKTRHNLYDAFVGEAKAHIRLLAFARKAEVEGYPQIGKLFRAIAAAEEVHAASHLRVLGEHVVKSTEENLAFSFERETTINEVTYPQLIKEAEQESERAAALSFTYARDVEEGHAALYKRAMDHLLQDESSDYYVCSVCGYTSDGTLPEKCPVCGASSEVFITIA